VTIVGVSVEFVVVSPESELPGVRCGVVVIIRRSWSLVAEPAFGEGLNELLTNENHL
jgi:hypothetical protein